MKKQQHLSFGFNRGDYMTPEFRQLWAVYPNHADPAGAFKEFKRLGLDKLEAERQMVIDHVVERAKWDRQWLEGKVPHLRTFLFNRRFLDDYIRTRGAPSTRDEDVDRRPRWEQEGYQTEAAYEAELAEAHARAKEELRRMRMLH